MSAPFVRQLRWELRRLWRRPRTYVGVVAVVLFEVLLYALLQLPEVRAPFLRGAARLHHELRVGDPLSALGNAVRVAAQTMLFIGWVWVTLVVSDVVAREAEDGTLRMAFCRPVSRASVFLQKLLVCAVYSVALTVLVGALALLLGVLIDGPGTISIVWPSESILGVHEFGPGVLRYAVAMLLLAASGLTVMLLAFALSCLPVKAATAGTVALMVLLADWAIQAHPTFAPISPYTLTVRLASWRQVFNDTIPWLRLERNYRDLALLDLALLAAAWWAFRRRPLAPR